VGTLRAEARSLRPSFSPILGTGSLTRQRLPAKDVHRVLRCCCRPGTTSRLRRLRTEVAERMRRRCAGGLSVEQRPNPPKGPASRDLTPGPYRKNIRPTRPLVRGCARRALFRRATTVQRRERARRNRRDVLPSNIILPVVFGAPRLTPSSGRRAVLNASGARCRLPATLFRARSILPRSVQQALWSRWWPEAAGDEH